MLPPGRLEFAASKAELNTSRFSPRPPLPETASLPPAPVAAPCPAVVSAHAGSQVPALRPLLLSTLLEQTLV